MKIDYQLGSYENLVQNYGVIVNFDKVKYALDINEVKKCFNALYDEVSTDAEVTGLKDMELVIIDTYPALSKDDDFTPLQDYLCFIGSGEQRALLINLGCSFFAYEQIKDKGLEDIKEFYCSFHIDEYQTNPIGYNAYFKMVKMKLDSIPTFLSKLKKQDAKRYAYSI